MKKYITFLENFRKCFSESIDAIVNNQELEDEMYKNIFINYSKNNKEIFEYMIKKIFNLNDDYSSIEDLINSGIVSCDKINFDLNKIIVEEISKKKKSILESNKRFFYYSNFNSILTYISDFAINNYFIWEDGKIKVRDLIATPNDCVSVVKKLRGESIPNYDAIMDKDGNIYLAIGFHDELIGYMTATSIDMSDGIRIADSDICEEYNRPTFDLSSLYKYFRVCVNEDDKFVYLSKSRIRKLCEFMKSAKPYLSKNLMASIFQKAEGFGYDFGSYSKSNNTNVNYYLAIENLRNVMDVLDEMYPEEKSIDLVKMCQNRFKELNYGIIE